MDDLIWMEFVEGVRIDWKEWGIEVWVWVFGFLFGLAGIFLISGEVTMDCDFEFKFWVLSLGVNKSLGLLGKCLF